MSHQKHHPPTRPALRYFGGKWKIAPWIISHFPPHTCYVEPYGGGASVLLRKAPAFIDVYNDKLKDVVYFFKVLRERPAELFAAISLTPYSRAEFLAAQKPIEDNRDPASAELEAARRFYVWAWQGRGRTGNKEPGGWRFMSRDTRSKTPVDDWVNIDHLWAIAARFRRITIEYDDALKVITRYDTPDTLFYLDPPYPTSTRSARWAQAYRHEYSDQDHQNLAQLLQSIQGMAIISSYPSNLYHDLYNGWTCRQHAGQTERPDPTTETLWISPNAQQALENSTHQLALTGCSEERLPCHG